MSITLLSKKLLAGLMAGSFLLISASVCAENESSATTELSFTMNSTYTLTVPASTQLTFGQENTEIGNVKVTGNMASDTLVIVSASKTPFSSGDNSFEYSLLQSTSGNNGTSSAFGSESWTYSEVSSGKEIPLIVNIPKATWDTVTPGTYNSTITFAVETQVME
jgi:type 1 fimbria pilin